MNHAKIDIWVPFWLKIEEFLSFLSKRQFFQNIHSKQPNYFILPTFRRFLWQFLAILVTLRPEFLQHRHKLNFLTIHCFENFVKIFRDTDLMVERSVLGNRPQESKLTHFLI